MWARNLIPAASMARSIGIGYLLLSWSPAVLTFGKDGKQETARAGAELFTREWTPGEPSQHGGDGLGPVYNETSCVACHNLGGVGGAGPKSKNAHLLSASVTPIEKGGGDGFRTRSRDLARQQMALLAKQGGKKFPDYRVEGQPVDRKPLIELHPGFEESSLVMVHRYGLERDYESWRAQTLDPEHVFFLSSDFGRESRVFQQSSRATSFSIPFEYGHFTLTQAELNPSPLFGAGLLDSIPDADIEANVSKPNVFGFRKLQGRVSRLGDGRIGRFGWKAQAASLDEFVLTACAVELGLEVPGHPQATNPRSPNTRSPGLDLSRSECTSLTKFVRGLPAPIEQTPANPDDAAIVSKGRKAFEKVGCNACHVRKLGPVDGIYSDLLLHDMGSALNDSGSYYSPTPDGDSKDGTLPGMMPNGPLAFEGAARPVQGPSRSEWRTPPLWGVRDSGPYLHDGRAETLEQAISFHSGEADRVTTAYFKLPMAERQAVLRFLKSLQAPNETVARGNGREAPDLRIAPDAVGLR